MELEGKVIAVLAPREGTSKAGNPWKAQECVIETMEQYPKKMCFEIFGTDRIAQFESLLQVGNNIKVSFDIDAREWNGRWFNSIRAWKVKLLIAPLLPQQLLAYSRCLQLMLSLQHLRLALLLLLAVVSLLTTCRSNRSEFLHTKKRKDI